jgi:hypothetical protein
MDAYEDPNHPGNAASHHTGKPCYNKCGRPAGTLWGPLLCHPCNVIRMKRIDDSMKRLAENLPRMATGPQHTAKK